MLRSIEQKTGAQFFFDVPVTRFAATRIAVDLNVIMNATMAKATENVSNRTNLALEDPDPAAITKEWITICLRKIISLLSRNIIPVCVADGPARKEKIVVAKRAQEREEKAKKLATLTAKVRSAELLASTVDIEELRKMWKFNFHVTKDQSALLYNILISTGIPCMRAKHDAEELCAVLCMEGYTEAVMSTDQDAMVFGAPLVIVEKKKDKKDKKVKSTALESYLVVDLQHTLNTLKLTFDQFTDMCILAGCDFNKNIPGFACRKAYDYLLSGKGIMDIYKKFGEEKFSKLEYKSCKDIFRLKVWEQVATTPLRLDLDLQLALKCGPQALAPYEPRFEGASAGLGAFLVSIVSHIKRLPSPPFCKCRNPIKGNFLCPVSTGDKTLS